MKRKHRRFKSEKEILDEIDTYKDEAAQCLAKAMEEDERSKRHFFTASEFQSQYDRMTPSKDRDSIWEQLCLHKKEGQDAKSAAMRLSRRRNTIEESTLPALKDCLARFKTRLLGFDEDDSVVLR